MTQRRKTNKQHKLTTKCKTNFEITLNLVFVEIILTHKSSLWSCLSSQSLGYGTDELNKRQPRTQKKKHKRLKIAPI